MEKSDTDRGEGVDLEQNATKIDVVTSRAQCCKLGIPSWTFGTPACGLVEELTINDVLCFGHRADHVAEIMRVRRQCRCANCD